MPRAKTLASVKGGRRKAREGSEKGAASLRRGFDILRAFSAIDSSLGNKEFVERTGLPKATVARLTYTLARMGYLRQSDSAGQYRLGERISVLGHALLRNLPVRQIARPMMEAFARQHEMSVALGIGDGAQVVYLDVTSGSELLGLKLRVGTMLPMHTTAMGLAYLSALPTAERESCFRAIKEARYSPPADIGQLRLDVERVAKDGYSVVVGKERPYIYGAGAPIWLDEGQLVLAMNCGSRRANQSTETYRKSLGPALVRLATDISSTVDRLGAKFWDD